MISPFQDFHMYRQKRQKDQHICLSSYISVFQKRYLIVKVLYYISGFLASPIPIVYFTLRVPIIERGCCMVGSIELLTLGVPNPRSYVSSLIKGSRFLLDV